MTQDPSDVSECESDCGARRGVDCDTFWDNAYTKKDLADISLPDDPDIDNEEGFVTVTKRDDRRERRSNGKKLTTSALELARNLFGPDATVVKTFRMSPDQATCDEEGLSHVALVDSSPYAARRVNPRSAELETPKKPTPVALPSRPLYSSVASGGVKLSKEQKRPAPIPPPQKTESTASGCDKFRALEVLSTIYKDVQPHEGSKFAKPTSSVSSYLSHEPLQQHILQSGLHSEQQQHQHKASKEQDDDEEMLNRRHRDFLTHYFRSLDRGQQKRGQHQYPWTDSRYTEYYEYLSRGIYRALDNPQSSFAADCGAGSLLTPSTETTSGTCLALKRNLYYQHNPGPEIYSRKVFVGGLPIDIDEDEISATFRRFGPLTVDWPNKLETKSYFPPKGYVFLIFEYEMSVRSLVDACFEEDDKLFMYVSSPLSPDKLVQIRPWKLADADYVVEPNAPIHVRRAVFVGGVPRPIKAVELAHILDKLYGPTVCAGIDTDVDYKYPKGAGRVVFAYENSYMKAIEDRYVQLSHGEIEKRVELKPYVLDDQPCDECEGERCNNRYAPFFCPQLNCLQYYCEKCWTDIHSSPEREDHRPLVKEA